jgi:prepilin-type N-terminal cleavage/methylation domain-containing protein
VQRTPVGLIRIRRAVERGATLIELMFAMLILAIGLGALTTLLSVAVSSDSRNSKDTSASLLAQMVIEQITAQHPNSTASIALTDCAGNAWTVATTGGASPSGAGANLQTSSSSLNYGGIDSSQSVSTIPAGYAMKYVDCGTPSNGGTPITYDVRWNVMTIDANQTRLVTASARPLAAGSNRLGGALFAMPVNLRAVGGP